MFMNLNCFTIMFCIIYIQNTNSQFDTERFLGRLERTFCYATHMHQKHQENFPCLAHGFKAFFSHCGALSELNQYGNISSMILPYAHTYSLDGCNFTNKINSSLHFPPASNWIPISTQHSSCKLDHNLQDYLPVTRNFEIHIVQPRFEMCYVCSPRWILKYVMIEVHFEKLMFNNSYSCKGRNFFKFGLNTSDVSNKVNMKVKFVISSVNINFTNSRIEYVVTEGFAVTVAARTKIEPSQCQSSALPIKLNCSLLSGIVDYADFVPTFQWFINDKRFTAWHEIRVEKPGFYECHKHVKFQSSPMYGYGTFEDIAIEKLQVTKGKFRYNEERDSNFRPLTDASTEKYAPVDVEIYIHISIALVVIIFVIVSAHLSFWLITNHRKKQIKFLTFARH